METIDGGVSIINTFRERHLPTSGYERKLCGAEDPGNAFRQNSTLRVVFVLSIGGI